MENSSESAGLGHHNSHEVGESFARGLICLAAATVLIIAVRTHPEKNGIYMDQMTFLLQSLSLARDWDLQYKPADRDRFQKLGWGKQPTGLYLRRKDSTFFFAKPISYSLCAAPFTLVSPNRGPLVLNALLWIAMLELSFRWLRRWMPPVYAAALAVACWGLTCVPYYVFVIHHDIFIMFMLTLFLYLALVPCASAAQTKGGDSRACSLSIARAVALGIAGGVLTYEKLPMVFFVSAMILMWWFRGNRRAALIAGGTFLLPCLIFASMHLAQDRSFSPYQGHRMIVGEQDPLLAKDHGAVPAANVRSREFFTASIMTRRLSTDNLKNMMKYFPRFCVYYVMGRRVGLFPYMVPFLVLGLVSVLHVFRRSGRQTLWVITPAAVYVLFYFALMPLQFHGGPTAIGNRYGAQMAPAFIFAFGGAWLSVASLRLVVPLLVGYALYFPGRVLLHPSTALRDNYLVFQWSRFRMLPLEGELLWRSCDRYDCSFDIDRRTKAFRLSEPDVDGMRDRFWLRPDARTRLGIVRMGDPGMPVKVRLASASYQVRGYITSGSNMTPFVVEPMTTVELEPLTSTPRQIDLGQMRHFLWDMEIVVAQAVETQADKSVAPDAALFVVFSQPDPGYPSVAANGECRIDAADPRSASLLLWGWHQAGTGTRHFRWAGSTSSSALTLPPRVVTAALDRLVVFGGTLDGPQQVTFEAPGMPAQHFTLRPEETSVTLRLMPSGGDATLPIYVFRHNQLRIPAKLTGNPEGDQRALTAWYWKFVFSHDVPTSVAKFGLEYPPATAFYIPLTR